MPTPAQPSPRTAPGPPPTDPDPGTKPYASAVLDAGADEVWAYVRDFGNLHEWMPAARAGFIEGGGPGDRAGCVRTLIGPGDSVFRERLLTLDDVGRSYTYEVLDCPLPIEDGHATVRVAPVTDGGGAFVEWHGRFRAAPGEEIAMTRAFAAGIYGPGLEALRRRFGGP